MLLAGLAEDHARFAEVLAIAMEAPIWDVRPDRGRSLVESIMRDERVTAKPPPCVSGASSPARTS